VGGAGSQPESVDASWLADRRSNLSDVAGGPSMIEAAFAEQMK
jgi:hypothetical protein